MKRICGFEPCLASRARSTGRTTAKLTIGRAERPLMAFVLVLSYSRYPFLRFYLNASLPNLKIRAYDKERRRKAKTRAVERAARVR